MFQYNINVFKQQFQFGFIIFMQQFLITQTQRFSTFYIATFLQDEFFLIFLVPMLRCKILIGKFSSHIHFNTDWIFFLIRKVDTNGLTATFYSTYQLRFFNGILYHFIFFKILKFTFILFSFSSKFTFTKNQ